MLTPQEIQSFLDNDRTSDAKRHARVGQRYYEGEHDIRKYRLFYYDADGNLQEDLTRSNIKIPHQFFTELVDQEVQYLLSGKGAFICSDKPELQKELDAHFNENDDFRSELTETATDSIVKGWAFLYAYRSAENRLAFQCADSLDVVEVDKRFMSDGKDYYIYRYVQRKNLQGDVISRIEIWDDADVTYFTQTGNGLRIAGA